MASRISSKDNPEVTQVVVSAELVGRCNALEYNRLLSTAFVQRCIVGQALQPDAHRRNSLELGKDVSWKA
jgi:hypothetical protein